MKIFYHRNDRQTNEVYDRNVNSNTRQIMFVRYTGQGRLTISRVEHAIELAEKDPFNLSKYQTVERSGDGYMVPEVRYFKVHHVYGKGVTPPLDAPEHTTGVNIHVDTLQQALVIASLELAGKDVHTFS